MTTLAVADPSNVITSRLDDVEGVLLPTVTVAVIERMIVPAVGKVG